MAACFRWRRVWAGTCRAGSDERGRSRDRGRRGRTGDRPDRVAHRRRADRGLAARHCRRPRGAGGDD
ncbi:MAG: hypothetical protein B7Z59_13215, partial [Acidiphilium sp. 37-67-22]